MIKPAIRKQEFIKVASRRNHTVLQLHSKFQMKYNIKFNEQDSTKKLNEHLITELAPSEVARFLSSATHNYLSTCTCLVHHRLLAGATEGQVQYLPIYYL